MKFVFTCFALLILWNGQAQSPKRADDVFFRKYLVRSVDLREKGNQVIFGHENQLVQILLNAYCSGEIKGYRNASLAQKLTYPEFEQRLSLMEVAGGELPVHALPLLEIGEQLIFDKHTSDFYFAMESLTIFVPADQNIRGLQEPLISFSYKDCEKIFKQDVDAVSLNPLKNGRNINYADVFLMRLFNSTLVKTGQLDDPYFDQKSPDAMTTFMMAKAEENRLTEYL